MLQNYETVSELAIKQTKAEALSGCQQIPTFS